MREIIEKRKRLFGSVEHKGADAAGIWGEHRQRPIKAASFMAVI